MNRVFGDAEVMRYGRGVQSLQWISGWLERCLEKYRQGAGTDPWAVVLKDACQPIGYCGLFCFADIGGQPEIEVGYRLARSHWGCGYATEAAMAVRNHAFETMGLKRLIAMVDPRNIASIRVAEKLGMHYEKDVMLEGYTHSDRVYVLEK